MKNCIDFCSFFQVMLLIRKPYDTILANYNLGLTKNNTGVANITDLVINKSLWIEKVEQNLQKYWNFHKYWITKKKIRKLVVFYQDLVQNVTKQLKRMITFLGFNASSEVLQCVRKNSEGHFHRKKEPEQRVLYDMLDSDLKAKLDETYKNTIVMVNKINEN